MGKKVAVVFDSAGTLVHMYRVARATADGSTLEDIETTMLVAGYPERALVVMHTGSGEIFREDPDLPIAEFIARHNIDIDIVCAGGDLSLGHVRGLIGGSNVRLAALRDVICMVHNHCPGIFYLAAGIIVDAGPGTISHTLSTGGKLYPRSGEVFSRLRERGVDTYVASGDSMRNLRRLADRLDIPLGNVFDTTSPEDKEDIVNRLKQRYSHVVMVGDGLNDLLAIRAADTGVVTRQQGDSRPSVLLEAADNVIDDIARVVDIVFPLLG